MENGKESSFKSRRDEAHFYDDRIDMPRNNNYFKLELDEEENKQVIDFANQINRARKIIKNEGHFPATFDGDTASTLNDMKIIAEFLKPISRDGAPSFEEARSFIWASNGFNPHNRSETIDEERQNEYFYNLTKRYYERLQKTSFEGADTNLILDNKENADTIKDGKSSKTAEQDNTSDNNEADDIKDRYAKVCQILQKHHIDEKRFWKQAEDGTLPIAMRTAGLTREETMFILSDKDE